MRNITAKARVQIIVEVDAGAPWGDDCSVGQMYKQAAESGCNKLLAALKPGMHGIVTIIGEPKVIGVITEKNI